MKTTDDTLCFYVPGKPGIIDIVAQRDGQTFGEMGGRTKEQLAIAYPGLAIGRLGDISAASNAMFRKPPDEITEERWIQMMEVLPPVGWTNRGRTESFKLSERTYGTVTEIFCRIGERYFVLSDDITLPHEQIVSKVETAIASNR